MIDNPGVNKAIARQHDRTTVVVGATAGAAGAIDVRSAAGLQMLVPAGTTGQAVAVYSCDTIDGTYLPLKDAAGDAVSITVAASEAYDLPEAIFSCHFVKFVSATDAFTATILAKG